MQSTFDINGIQITVVGQNVSYCPLRGVLLIHRVAVVYLSTSRKKLILSHPPKKQKAKIICGLSELVFGHGSMVVEGGNKIAIEVIEKPGQLPIINIKTSQSY